MPRADIISGETDGDAIVSKGETGLARPIETARQRMKYLETSCSAIDSDFHEIVVRRFNLSLSDDERWTLIVSVRVDAWHRARVTGYRCSDLLRPAISYAVLLFRFHQRDKWPYGDTERNRAAAGRAKKLSLQSPRRDLKEPQGSENWYEKVHYQVAKHTSGRRGHVPGAFGPRARPFRSPRPSPRCFRSSPHPIPPVSAATLPSRHPLSSSNGSSGPVASAIPVPAAEFQITADIRGLVQSDPPPPPPSPFDLSVVSGRNHTRVFVRD